MQNKVLVISTTPFYGGGESFIVNTLDKVSKSNVYFVNNQPLYNKLNKRCAIMFKSRNILSQIIEVRTFLRLHNDINNVIFNGGNTIFFIPFIYAGNKIFYRHTTNKCIENKYRRLLYIILWNLCYLFADKIVHVSNYSLHEQKLACSKALCIHHGIDVSIPYIERDSVKKILFVGRLDKAKGIDIIIDAFLNLPKDQFCLDIVGSGELETYVKEKECSNIKYWGFQNDVSSFYQKADIFITLPTNEAFGLTIIEAMRFSLPIISCKTGGINEIVKDHVNGFLVPRNSNSIIEAIMEMKNNITLYKSMSAKSYLMVNCEFSRTNTITNIRKILK